MNLTLCYLVAVVGCSLSAMVIAIALAFLSRLLEWDGWLWHKLNKDLDCFFDWAMEKLLGKPEIKE